MTSQNSPSTKKKVGSLNKKGFSDYTETQCQRQLFIRLGEHDPRWVQREVEVRQGLSGTAKSHAELGKLYEQQVYRRLLRNFKKQVRCSLKPPLRKEVTQTTMTRELAIQLHQILKGCNQRLLLLEHEWPVSESFVRRIFGQGADEELATLGNQELRRLRPDIMVVGNAPEDGKNPPRSLLGGGDVAQLTVEDLKERVGIALFDIKNAPEERIGRRHFSEMLFYAHALADWLQETGLDEFFFVRCDGHGIFGYLDEDTLHDVELEQIVWYRTDAFKAEDAPLVSPLVWEDTSHLFEHAEAAARDLWQLAQGGTEVEQIPCAIQPGCGRCPFIDDCISTLKGNNPEEPHGWDIRLIPYLKSAVAEQLNEHGIHTIGELLEKVDQLDLGDTPVPLHAELPSLKLRARALAEQEMKLPEDGHLSLALPKYINMALVFDFEVDQRNDLIFCFGFYLNAKAPSFTLGQRHERWWGAWRQVLNRAKENSKLNLDPVMECLDLEGLRLDWFNGDDFDHRLHSLLGEMGKHLLALEEDGILTLGARGDTINLGQNEIQLTKAPLVRCQYSYVSGGLESEHEFMLLQNLIQKAHRVVRICSITEMFAIARHEERSYFFRQNFAGFYWSTEQVEHLRALVERHLPLLQEDLELSTQFSELIDWMTPAESDVKHHALHKKMYDLRAFVETSAGFPQLINYTWHQTVAYWREGFEANPLFWVPHFNHMDFTIWHEALQELDTRKRAEKEASICMQMEQKMRGLHEILRHLHREAREVIPKESKTMTSRDFYSVRHRPFHRLGALWQSYHQLNAAATTLANDASRLTWPEQSVAKLHAGKASELVVTIEERESREFEILRFALLGLSSHMKVSEGSRVLILHRKMRDSHQFPFNNLESLCQIIIEEMAWDASSQGYRVTACRQSKLKKGHEEGKKKSDTPETFSDLLTLYDAEDWFLYPTDLDVWTGRLATNKDALLKRRNLGKSWLAERLMFLHGLGGEVLEAPEELEVGAAELYAFAPQLLPRKRDLTGEELLTPVRWRPDPSQREGILRALSHPVFCLQGPPGTGKSQTIIALIDEFLERHKGPARILVSAFSYSALEVVAQKLLESRYGAGDEPEPNKLSDAARLPIFYASSSFEKDKFPHHPEQLPVMHLAIGSSGCVVDGERVDFRRAPRKARLFERIFWLKDLHENDGSFVLFANAHSLYHLGSKKKNGQLKYLEEGFGFDLIIIDEASQMPANYFTAIAQVVKPFQARLALPEDKEARAQRLVDAPEELSVEGAPNADDLTHVVLVGDQEQLPPIQQIEPPRKLKPMLDSVFRYFLEVHETPKLQLAFNYRSHRDIVRCVRRLAIYDDLYAFHQDDQYLEPIPDLVPASITAPWLQQLLGQRQVVSALIHQKQWDTALSSFEAQLTAEVLVAFFTQKGVDTAEKERVFWQEDVGVVSPHNAHGRLIVRETAQRLLTGDGAKTNLPESELMEMLASTVYSVEKFQGSDRSLIVGSFGVSSTDRLAAEESFLYDMSRFNVLISRAKHKMLLICSQNYLDYVPRNREVMSVAARVREYAYHLCGASQSFEVIHKGQAEIVELRWMEPRESPSAGSLPSLNAIPYS